ncbi:MAG: VWA domain-containing protein [Dinghuibacter sp.]|nr:VWA domain-containing protein [Dinghuibacter sp.]
MFWVLGSLLVPLFLFILYLRWKKNVVRKNNYGAAFVRLAATHSSFAFLTRFLFIFFALGLLILALVNLQQPGKGANITRKGNDLVFALDISKSMLAEDVKPSRLERAKLLINKISEDWPNSRTGLVVFAGRAYLQMPLTFDVAAARMLVNTASPENVPAAGTAISEALKLSSTAFGTPEKKYKAVIMITDGEDHGQGAIQEARNLKDSGAMLLTIGMGSEQGAPVIDPVAKDFKKDISGKTVISKLNAPLLKELATVTGGAYIHYTETEEVLKEVKKELAVLGQKNIPDKSLVNYESYYAWFLLAALCFLLADLFVSENKRSWKAVMVG